MKKQTVHQLRKNGWRVKVGHKRLLFKYDPKTGAKITQLCLFKNWKDEYPEYFLSPKGGETEVSLTSPDNVDIFGRSFCLNEDYYNSTIGLKIALGRALENYKNYQSDWFHDLKNV